MSVETADTEATRKACGVLVARPQGYSWALPLSIRFVVNVGTIERSSTLDNDGKARRRLKIARRDGASVVVCDWESQLHGEGKQQIRRLDSEMTGGRL
jgi:hypothetical protein